MDSKPKHNCRKLSVKAGVKRRTCYLFCLRKGQNFKNKATHICRIADRSLRIQRPPFPSPPHLTPHSSPYKLFLSLCMPSKKSLKWERLMTSANHRRPREEEKFEANFSLVSFPSYSAYHLNSFISTSFLLGLFFCWFVLLFFFSSKVNCG